MKRINISYALPINPAFDKAAVAYVEAIGGKFLENGEGLGYRDLFFDVPEDRYEEAWETLSSSAGEDWVKLC